MSNKYLSIETKKLKMLIRKTGYTYKVLARKIGKSAPTISRWISNAKIPQKSYEEIEALAGCGLTPDLRSVSLEELISSVEERGWKVILERKN